MSAYTPLFIGGNSTGLVQDRENFLLPSDAYPTLENAFVWRERIKRKQAYQLLGRLRRVLSSVTLSVQANLGSAVFADVLNDPSINVRATQPNAQIQPGSVTIVVGALTYRDTAADGTLVTSPASANVGDINYITGRLSLTFVPPIGLTNVDVTLSYFPNLPVMGIRTRDLSPVNAEMTVFFDTRYAYNFTAGGFVEFISGTTWSSTLPQADSNFFWSTNYWVSTANIKIFWVTNFSGQTGDPIRYTNGTGSGSGFWVNFAPQIAIDPILGAIFLEQCLCMLPFRSRMLVFNTLEGTSLATSIQYPQRIRWAAIGTPFTVVGTIPVSVNANAWRDDIRGQGGYIDIPTNEDIVTVGFVRDNLVIYCERSTWQLRYTGRSISPFQIEKVNTELGAGSTFSGVQFDTSLVGIGDKGVVQCNSVESERIDVKIPDLIMEHVNNNNFGQKRVHGIRNFLLRLAYWTYPETDNNGIFPDRRLVYNYENDSWAIFTDSLTTLGTFQPVGSRTWANPAGSTTDVKVQWEEANFPWVNKQEAILSIVGGNQQGYVEYLDQQTTNDESLTITAITGNTTTATQLTSPNHNLQTGDVVKVKSIPTGTPFATSLNNQIFGVVKTSADTILIKKYSSATGEFSDPQLDAPATYIGAGQICVRDNFSIVSKKFNFLEQGQNIQIGYVDVLMTTIEDGAITMNMFVNYNDTQPINVGNSFFNTIISTNPNYSGTGFPSNGEASEKTNQRVFCASRGNYLTIEYTFSNAQMNGSEQERDVQIDMQVLWQRPAGRIQTF